MAKITIQKGATQQIKSSGSLSSTSRLTQRISTRPGTQRLSATAAQRTSSQDQARRPKKPSGPPVALWISLGVVGFIIIICIVVAASNKGQQTQQYRMPAAGTKTQPYQQQGNWDSSMGEWMKDRGPTKMAKDRNSSRRSGGHQR